jgi:hypothetical protein
VADGGQASKRVEKRTLRDQSDEDDDEDEDEDVVVAKSKDKRGAKRNNGRDNAKRDDAVSEGRFLRTWRTRQPRQRGKLAVTRTCRRGSMSTVARQEG